MILLTYKALGSFIANYAEPAWNTNASDSSIEKIIFTVRTKMLHVVDHMNLLFAQYLVHCLYGDNVCLHITTMDHPPRELKVTLFTRHNQTVLPLLANIKKDSLQAIHISFVNTAIDNMTDKRVLNNRSPPINDETIGEMSCLDPENLE